MIYALDSNIVSFLLRPSKNPEVVDQFERIVGQGHDYVIPPLAPDFFFPAILTFDLLFQFGSVFFS